MQNTPKAACEAPQSPVGLMTRKQDKQISPNPPLPLFNQRNVLVYTRESKQFHLMKGILLHLKKKKRKPWKKVFQTSYCILQQDSFNSDE
jgi:hypothetical protein